MDTHAHDTQEAKMLNIVLVEPEIPANTGNIGRTCVLTGARLHLVGPLGFELSDRAVQRAGLAYWESLDVRTYESWDDFAGSSLPAGFDHVHLFTKAGRRVFSDASYSPDDWLVFGKESSGLSESLLLAHPDRTVRIPMLDDRIEAILNKAERLRHDDLSHSQWALGIITGNNAKALKTRPRKGLEPIFTGKDINKYGLKKASRYIKYNRVDFQQCAKDEFYRAKEKLVYKFVSSRLCFTYDDKQRLFLNSANILIPEIDGMSTKTVLAFLNSTLFNFLYAKRFNDIKILKGNLSALPFPKISAEQDQQLSAFVNQAMSGDISAEEKINSLIFTLYELNQEEIALVGAI